MLLLAVVSLAWIENGELMAEVTTGIFPASTPPRRVDAQQKPTEEAANNTMPTRGQKAK